MYSIFGRGSFCFNYFIRSGEFAGRAFGSVGRCQILLENEISILKNLVSRRKHEVLQNFLVNGLVFKKHNGPTLADDIATQIITDCENLRNLGYELLHPSSRL